MPNGKIPTLNLVRQVNAESPTRKPGFYKPLVFDALTVVSAVVLGYMYRAYLLGNYGLTPVLFAAGVFLIFSALQLFFTKYLWRRFLVLILQGGGIFLFFYNYDYRFIGVAAAFFLVLPFFGEILGRRELENSMEVRFFRTARPVLAKWTTALVVIAIIFYLPQWDAERSFVSKSNFQVFYDWAAGLAGSLYPNIKFDSSFGELAAGFAEFQLKKDPAFAGLPPYAKEQAVQETAQGVAERLSEALGSPLDAKAGVGDILYNFIVNLLGGWRERFGDLFLWAWGLAIFLMLRGFGAIFYWIVGFFAFVIYQILVASNFVHIIGETRTKEVIEW